MVVGIAATAVVFFVMCRFRRKRTVRQRDRDTTVAETLAEHGIGRLHLIDSNDDHPSNGPRTVITPTGSGNNVEVGRTSPPNLSLSGINLAPVSTGGFNRHLNNPAYPAGNLGRTYNPYAGNQVPYRYAEPGPSNPSGVPNFSVPSGSGVGLPFFNHSPQDSMGSSEPLLGVSSDIDASLDPVIPSVPPRNPLRLTGGVENMPSSVGGRGNGGSLNEESHIDDDDIEYGALRTGSLKVRLGAADPVHISDCLRSALGSK